MTRINTIISGTGSYVPSRIVKNSDFVKQVFFEKDQTVIDTDSEMIVSKFRDITGIAERRWVSGTLPILLLLLQKRPLSGLASTPKLSTI